MVLHLHQHNIGYTADGFNYSQAHNNRKPTKTYIKQKYKTYIKTYET